jgi:ParB family chromosome partitioning protein
MLIPEFISMLNDDKIGIIPAVNISFLSQDEQNTLCHVLAGGKYRVTLKNSEEIKRAKQNNVELSEDTIREILDDVKQQSKYANKSISVNRDIYDRFFKKEKDKDKIQGIINEALERYFAESAE